VDGLSSTRASVLRRLAILLVVLGLLAAACGGGDDSEATDQPTIPEPTASVGDDEGEGPAEPQQGGRMVYALEAETTNGWCLPESQLAISGIQVARTIYDTLMVLNENGDPVPWLAESMEPNDDYTEWTIKVREGVKFHDGTDLDAQVVANNLNAYRGAYEGRSPLLFVFVFQNIADVQVTGPMEVTVTTTVPWPGLPTFLWGSGRVGMVAQAQLDDPDTCFRNLIGTGPFMFKEWVVNDHLTVERNPNWWYAELSGEPYPYLDEIVYRPIIGGPARLRALEGGEIDAGHFSGGRQIAQLERMAEEGRINLEQSNLFGELSYVMLNAEKPPFDNINARRAVTLARDRATEVEVLADGVGVPATGPFAPGNIGFLESTPFPEFDLDAAREAVEAYEAETGQPLEFTYTHPADPDNVETAQFLQQEWQAAGMRVSLSQEPDQSQYIDLAIAGNFQAIGWRNHPGGGSPDSQYNWWYPGSPVNFGRIPDPEIQRLLDEGRVETDPDKSRAIYEELNVRFAEQLWNSWGTWTTWSIPSKPTLHGIFGPDSIDGTGPFPGLATGHPVFGIYIDQG
jgi:peptide/nickel transport system substrate-binding protein